MTGYTFYELNVDPSPKVGSFICFDDHNSSGPNSAGEYLQSCNDWDRAQFRFPVTSLRIPYAVNVAVTGRTVQVDNYHNRWVRIAVTFVGDDEPDVTRRGWMLVN
jgi:hypothetical protein